VTVYADAEMRKPAWDGTRMGTDPSYARVVTPMLSPGPPSGADCRDDGRQPTGALAASRWYSFYTEEVRSVEFEFDPHKSATNQEKHGIDFTSAPRLWQDVIRVEVPARTVDETRWLVIGQIDGQHLSAVVTYREQRTRIISVRRSRNEEVSIYES
jgi:hypothetical protein